MSEVHSVELEAAWWATLDQQGAWLCVRLHPAGDLRPPPPGLIERLWKEVTARQSRDVVLEMDDVEFLASSLMGVLVRLHKRLAVHSGRLRLCGLRSECAEALHICRLDTILPTFDSRHGALR